MEKFTYQCATKIIFGEDTENQVGEETKRFSRNILLLYGGKSIRHIGLYDTVTDSLRKAGVSFTELPGVVPNPHLSLVNEGIRICRENKIEFILAVGGGSAIDTAKAIATGVHHEGDVWDFFEKHIPIINAIPIGVVLTIPAAGSEASPNSVITNAKTKRKLAIGSDLLRPRFAIMDPKITLSLPQNQRAAGIADMMAHIFERYFTNTKDADLTDKLCEATLQSIIKNARAIIRNPKDLAAASEIMWASTIAHNGLLGTGRVEDWATHRIEHELSALYDVTHGVGLAVMFPAWMKYVYKHDIRRFIQFANNVWLIEGNDEETALKGIEATKQFFTEIGLPTSLRDLKIDGRDFQKMAKLCTPVGNFVRLEEKDVTEIYNLAA